MLKTEYDAFCPKNVELINGYYYLMPGQKNLPINPKAYEEMTGSEFVIPERYLQVPCGYKKNNTNNNTNQNDKYTGTSSAVDELNNIKNQDEDDEQEGTSNARPGGHGRGASQYGLKYFGGFNYTYEALDRLFFDDGIFVIRSAVIDDTTCPNAEILDL